MTDNVTYHYFLGLKNLTNIYQTCELIKLDNPSFTLPKDENDPKVYDMLAKGDVTGVFQLESKGMRDVIMQLKTSSLQDIISALALYRPGPMEIIPTFIARKFNRERVFYPHDDLQDILKETYGTIVYQEQIMMIARKFAGYSLGRADILRRAVSKKKKEDLEKERISFVSSAKKLNYDEKVANDIYDYIVKFADYGFNKAHSVAYAKVAYLTAYLKYYYPTYYMSTLMTSFIGSSTDIMNYYKEAKSKNIPVFAPNINLSTCEFITYKNGILFPLTIIKGLGEVKAKELIEERNNNGIYKDYKSFVLRTKNIIPYSVLNNIIYSGALNEFNLTRQAMVQSADGIIKMEDFKGIPGMLVQKFTENEFSFNHLMDKEKEVLGLNIQYTFLSLFASYYQSKQFSYIKEAKEGTTIQTLGIIKNIKEIKTKNNEDMAFARLLDDYSEIELTLFPRVYETIKTIEEGEIVRVKGNVQRRNNLQIVVNDIAIFRRT